MNHTNFDPKTYEEKWQKKWKEENIYSRKRESEKGKGKEKKKFYSLYSFPYPSGEGLHVGHVEGMVANDIPARYHRMKGKDVVLPMGWDSFGLPAENFAIKTGVHPAETTEKSIQNFKKQIDLLGISVDWDTEVGAHWPEYYKWTQWIFLQMYKKGVAYKKSAPVNWCPKDQTVLANEQVINGRCERCDSEVIQKEMEQWFFKITDYAERLNNDLNKINWPESTKQQQRNWIGKSEGAKVKFKIKNAYSNLEVEVFTTAHDTIYGATFISISPEHPFLIKNLDLFLNKEEVQSYISSARNKTDLERQSNKDKTGVKIEGIIALNPLSGEEIPVYIADYALMGYGTGIVMGVPGHDDRDNEFAVKYNIPIIYVVEGYNELLSFSEKIKKDPKNFILKNSGEFDGLDFEVGRTKILKKLVDMGIAESVTMYRLRDWLVSRQRYWGCPIPIIYDPEGNAHPIDEKDLPLLLPTDVDFRPTGESPIARSVEFKKSAEEKYGKGWHYEVDTMDTFVDSSWYFFRHIDPHNQEIFASKENADFWLPTDLYMIGTEHTVLHLLYSRFFTKFFYDEGYISFDEPFYYMRHMGLIQGPDGRKMSKRWGNVINPTDEVNKYGADAVRMYEMFMGPLEDAKPWNDRAESGVFRFLAKVWDLQNKVIQDSRFKNQEVIINKLIKKVSEDIESLSFNTSVAKFMEAVNFFQKEESISKNVWETFLKTLAPFAPYITEELWGRLGYAESIHLQSWPEFNPDIITDEKAKIAVQVNGKVRLVLEVENDANENNVLDLAMADDRIKRFITNNPKKIIFVKNKVLNIII